MESEGLSRRSKRSNGVRLSAMLSAAGSVFLAGCGQDPVPQPQQAAAIEPGSKPVQAFENVFECAANSDMTQEQCADARKEAVATSEKVAPRYAGQGDCENDWGAGKCTQQSLGGGGHFFAPFVGGFLLGKLLQNGKREFLPLYRKSGDQGFSTANGARLGYGGAPGKYFASARAMELPKSVPAMKANSGAVSRGGMAARDEEQSSGGRHRWRFGG